MRKPAALFFDLDDTLLDDHASVLRSLDLVCEHVLHPALAALDLNAFRTVYRALADGFWESGTVRQDDQNTSRLMLWRRALASFGCEDEALALAARDAYAAYRIENPIVFEDAIPLLATLGRHYPLAVISNGGSQAQRTKLADAGLAGFFDFVVTSDDFGATKPDPAIFHHTAQRLGVNPSAAWHVGDSLANDVAGARQAGLHAVWLNRDGQTREAHHAEPPAEIASLGELRSLLDGRP